MDCVIYQIIIYLIQRGECGNKTTLPYFVANIVKILDIEAIEKDQQDQSVTDYNATISGKGVVIKTTTRQTIFLPVTRLLNASQLKSAELIGINKDGYMLYEKLPTEYDARVKTMEVDENLQEDYTDIGGLDKQIEELREAIVLPIVHKERFENIGIRPPKGVLMHGPPGTGKTMMAGACIAQTKATFLKLAGPQLVQMFIGDGAKMVRDAFQLAQVFIDELDAIGTKRYDSDKNGDREVQRTMLELLNQLDGFSPDDRIKVIAATNRPDILDPALLRSGRLYRKLNSHYQIKKPEHKSQKFIPGKCLLLKKPLIMSKLLEVLMNLMEHKQKLSALKLV
ncbi:unnamed protein product [Paramecium sonneborni]|uniref:AAA+ ATPase domain-containing protein n=1 Tax=Paramecium sonneborni TaxID=65129 RepID=A0A8S1PD72_9CILI|nr:unnamed protein product [Paramecium sonneborni]